MISEMNWMDVERQVARDTRCVVPVGSVEQHAQLSLCVDVINSERVAREAAEPLGVPVYPVIPYGMTPYFSAYPGTVTLRIETLMALMRDIIASLRRTGFKRILIVNGHGGNSAVGALGQELMADYGDISVRLHNWWNAPKTAAKTAEIHPIGTHANWMENFPWTRLNPPIEIRGSWMSNFGEMEEIASFNWNAMTVISYDNAENFAVGRKAGARYGGDPGGNAAKGERNSGRR